MDWIPQTAITEARMKIVTPHTFRKRVTVYLLLTAVLAQSLTGCTRRFWREQGDAAAYDAVSEKLTDERWMNPRMDIAADPRSRFFDPYDPDEEPLPPDDPEAHKLMHCVDGHDGYEHWHKFGEVISVENPNWLIPYTNTLTPNPVDSHGQVEIPALTLTECVDLAYIHSREYQSAIEDVYLQALTVTEQRYLLNTRFLIAGPGLGGGLFSSNRTFSNGGVQSQSLQTGIGAQQLLPSGAQLSVDVLNTITWNVGSAQGSAPRLAWSLTQPLLAQAGRKIVLENITQAERNLLYQVRTLARFRQQQFVLVATDFLRIQQQQQTILNQENNIRQLKDQIEGQLFKSRLPVGAVSESIPQIPEGLQIPEPLQGKLVVEVQPGNKPQPTGLVRWTQPGPISDEEKQAMLAVSDSPTWQAAIRQLFSYKEGQQTNLNTAQLTSRLNEAESSLLTSRRALNDTLDAFKLRLGLPTNVSIQLDLSFLDQFESIEKALIEATTELKQFQYEMGVTIAAGVDGAPEYSALQAYSSRLQEIGGKLQRVGLDTVKADFVPVRELLSATSSERLQPAEGRSFVTSEERDQLIKNVAYDLDKYTLAEADFNRYSLALRMINELLSAESAEAMFAMLDKDGSGMIEPVELPEEWPNIPSYEKEANIPNYDLAGFLLQLRESAERIRGRFIVVTQGLQVVQVGLRAEVIALNLFRLEGGNDFPSLEEVTRIALQNRHDLMNARGAVMDSRRQVEIAANRLTGRLNLSADGQVDADAGLNDSINLTLDFKTPIDQVGLRNDYNAALVSYQRARREYMRQEDGVKQEVRRSYRQLVVSEGRVNIARASLRIASYQYDNLQISSGQSQSNSLSLLQSLDSILRSQNALIGDWVTYETNRLNIFRDMGIMRIDTTGLWVDDYYLRDSQPTSKDMPEAGELFPQLPPAPPTPAPSGPVPPGDE